MSTIETKSFGDWGNLAVAKHFQKILKHEEGVFEGKDPEELHQMRVGMRRLRSAIAGFSPALVLPKTVTDSKIAKIARILGKLRDLDVLTETFTLRYLPILPDSEQINLKPVLDNLAKKRRQATIGVVKGLNHSNYQKLKADLEQWVDHPTYTSLGHISLELVLRDLLLPDLSGFLLHPGWLVGTNFSTETLPHPQTLTAPEIETILSEQGEILHSLRKVAKKLRYQLELFTEFYGEEYQNYTEDVKNLQTILGEIQDCFILEQFLDKHLSNWRQTIPSLGIQLQKIRLDSYQAWQQLQTKFLTPEVRQSFHRGIDR